MSNVSLKGSPNRKSDIKILTVIISVFIIIVWLCTPPGNKFAQLCLYGNNTRFLLAKIFNPDRITEYTFHRDNVKYLVSMDYKKDALKEMDLAIKTLPDFISDDVLYQLYQDRGDLRLFYGEYKGALDDFLFIKNPSLDIKLKIALIMNDLGYGKMALKYCNELVNADENSYPGFACIAAVYAKKGNPATSVKVLDLLIDRSPGKARYYVERANYKKMLGDTFGYDEDIAKAKEISINIDVNNTLVNDVLHPQKYVMTNIK